MDEDDLTSEGIDEEDEATDGRRINPGRAQVRSETLRFVVRGYLDVTQLADADLPPEPMHTDDRELRRRKDAARGVAAAEALENSLSSAVPTLPVRAIAQLSSEPKAGGPGVLLPEIFAVVLGDDPIGRIADYIALGVALRAGLNWLKAHGGKEMTVDGGNAFLLASTAIHEAGGPNDLKLQFVQEIHSVAYDWAEWESELQGFLVGFRDNGTLYQVAVALDGTVGTVTQVPIEVLRSSEPDDFDNV